MFYLRGDVKVPIRPLMEFDFKLLYLSMRKFSKSCKKYLTYSVTVLEMPE